jgi:hypothetical protein
VIKIQKCRMRSKSFFPKHHAGEINTMTRKTRKKKKFHFVSSFFRAFVITLFSVWVCLRLIRLFFQAEFVKVFVDGDGVIPVKASQAEVTLLDAGSFNQIIHGQVL